MRAQGWLTVAACVFVTACIESKAIVCGENVCPGDSTCDEATGLCIPAGCGDGQVSGTEECDGTDLGGRDCTFYGYYTPGALQCSIVCTYVEDSCADAQICGDHIVNGDEICDGAPPIGQTCMDYNFDLGRLGCSNACSPAFGSCAAIGWPIVGGDGVHPMTSVWGSSDSDVFAVGAGGTILHSDGGSWTAMQSGVTVALWAVFGFAPNNVYAVGDGGTILHYDGTTWSAMASMTTKALLAVWGASPNDIYAVGAENTIAHYDGVVWTVTQWPAKTPTGGSTPIFHELHGVYGTNGAVVIAGAETNGVGNILLRKPSGGTFVDETVDDVAYDLNAVFAVDDMFFVVGGTTAQSNTRIVLRYDGAWSEEIGAGEQLYSVWGTSANELVMGGFNGYLVRYTGGDYHVIDTQTTRQFNSLWGVDQGRVFAASFGGYVHRHDGIEWAPPSEIGYVGWNLTGLARYADGRMMFTGENGQIWELDAAGTKTDRSFGPLCDMTSVWVADDGTAFVSTAGNPTASSVGIVKKGPSDLGFVATGLNTGAYEEVWGTSSSNVYAVGGTLNNTQLRRYNGSAWTPLITGQTAFGKLLGIWGSGPNDIYVVTANGKLLHATDGTTFTEIAGFGADPTIALRDVWGTGPNDVYVCGDAGTIHHFDGTAWRKVTFAGSEILLGISGSGPHDIFISGTGVLLHYDGISWSRMALPTVFSPSKVDTVAREVTITGRGPGILQLERSCATTERKCGDPWDNDCDGMLNCEDADCATAPECTRGGACVVAQTLACNTSSAGTTYTGTSRFDELPCVTRSTGASEMTYRIDAPAGSVTLTLDGATSDIEMAVFEGSLAGDACDPTTCDAATGGTITVTSDGTPLYVVVDAPVLGGSDFTITATCN